MTASWFNQHFEPPCRRRVLPLLLLTLLSFAASAQTPAKLERLVNTVGEVASGDRAIEAIRFLQQHWRDGGNQAFNLCMDYFAASLAAGGYQENDTLLRLDVRNVRVEGEHSWQPFAATLRVSAPLDTLLHTLEREKMTLCVNSHSTPIGGISGELVAIDEMPDIPPGGLAGMLAYTGAEPAEVFERAVVVGGAAGIISWAIPAYNRPHEHREVVSMNHIPFVDQPPAFAFKISSGSNTLLDSLLAQGEVRLHAEVLTQFLPKAVHEVTAELVGTDLREERIIIAAHVDEPGANDNASGAAALLTIAQSLATMVRRGELASPRRTITMKWVEEYDTILRWQRRSPEEFQQIKAALVLDMVGQDVSKTGGRFLIERSPDPAAIWTRPPDRHTEWGTEEGSELELRGYCLNDLFRSACETRAAGNGWQVGTNPFEGGSDHVPFLEAGIPAVLAWHFTDVYYHTSGDDLDKVSSAELENVAVSTAATAYFLATVTSEDVSALLLLLQQRALDRLRNEFQNSSRMLASGEQSWEHEERILRAWLQWYREAIQHAGALLPISERGRVEGDMAAATQALEESFTSRLAALRDSTVR